MNREELTQLKKSLEAQATEGLELYNKAIGALELLNYFFGKLGDDDNDTGNAVNPDGTAGGNGHAGTREFTDTSRAQPKDRDIA